MGFFDLSIPYEGSLPSGKTNRTKLVVKAMELGYSGIAYDRTIKGVMSDKDRCSIPLLTLSSLLKLAPSLSSSVEFHRDLLGVSRSTPFHQYTRLTVCVDSPSQVLALNSGNPVLKTYNLISARPLNQNAFDQACEKSEVDIIAIDFSAKLPFRLKQHMIKAAIERGVYFEITYSKLIADVHLRRQLISNSKLLVDWTRGKNLILSSAASSVDELRGPYDVANLSSLLGLSMERAKSALSKNCRTLIEKAIRKKQFFKEAIKVENLSSGEKFDPEGPWTGDWLKWDSISSGEGDFLLDDMAKSFAASSNEPKTVKAIDFTSIVSGKPSNGFQVKDLISGSESASLSSNYNKTIFALEKLGGVQVATNNLLVQPKELDPYPQLAPCSFSDAEVKDRDSKKKSEFVQKFNNIDSINESFNDEIVCNMEEESRIHQPSHGIGVNTEEVSPSCGGMTTSVTLRLLNVNATFEVSCSASHPISSECIGFSSLIEEHEGATNSDGVLALGNVLMDNVKTVISENKEDTLFSLDDIAIQEDSLEPERFPKPETEGATNSYGDLALGNVLMDNVKTIIPENKEDTLFSLDDLAMQEKSLEPERFTKPETEARLMEENFMELLETFSEPMSRESYLSCDGSKLEEGGSSNANELPSDLVMEYKMQQDTDKDRSHPTFVQSPSGKCRGKRRMHNRALMFPLKRLLNPVAFKKPHKAKSNKRGHVQ